MTLKYYIILTLKNNDNRWIWNKAIRRIEFLNRLSLINYFKLLDLLLIYFFGKCF